MSTIKTGEAIKAARTGAGLTQAALAGELGISATELSKAERGEKELTQAMLKQIAKLTGVTQASLLDAEKKPAAKKPAASTAKQTTAKKTTAKKTTAKKTETAGTSLKLTQAEEELVRLYRKASASKKKSVMEALKEEKTQSQEIIENILGEALTMLVNNGKK